MRCRACARLLERLSVARAAAALCAAPVCRLAQPGLLVSAFPSYLLFPAGDVVEAAYDVLCMLVSYMPLAWLVCLHGVRTTEQLGLRAIH